MSLQLKLARLFMVGAAATTLAACAGTPTRESTGEYIDDTVITSKVKAKFVESDAVSAAAVNVETYKGAVQLSGFVPSETERRRRRRTGRRGRGRQAANANATNASSARYLVLYDGTAEYSWVGGLYAIMLANLLGSYECAASWKLLTTYLDGIRKVTAADVQRVARQYIVPDNRTVAILIPTKPGGGAPPAK